MGIDNPQSKWPGGIDTVYSSELQVDPKRASEFIAALWQGRFPPGLKLHSWVVVQNPWRTRLVWEAEDDEAKDFIERRLGQFGELKTEMATNSLGASFTAFKKRDADAFGEWLIEVGAPKDTNDYQVELRKRASAAPDLEAATAIGKSFGEYRKPL